MGPWGRWSWNLERDRPWSDTRAAPGRFDRPSLAACQRLLERAADRSPWLRVLLLAAAATCRALRKHGKLMQRVDPHIAEPGTIDVVADVRQGHHIARRRDAEGSGGERGCGRESGIMLMAEGAGRCIGARQALVIEQHTSEGCARIARSIVRRLTIPERYGDLARQLKDIGQRQ